MVILAKHEWHELFNIVDFFYNNLLCKYLVFCVTLFRKIIYAFSVHDKIDIVKCYLRKEYPETILHVISTDKCFNFWKIGKIALSSSYNIAINTLYEVPLIIRYSQILLK